MNAKPTAKENREMRRMMEWWDSWRLPGMKKGEVLGLAVLSHMMEDEEFRKIVVKKLEGRNKIRTK